MRAKSIKTYQSNYITADMLTGRPWRMQIREATLADLYIRREGEHVPHLILWFEGTERGLVLNKTRLEQLIQITGTDETDDWRGVKITLTPTTQAGKPTIHIVRATGGSPPNENQQ